MRVFILAGGEGVADRAAQRLRSRYPGIGIVGTHHGYVSGKAASAEAVALINAASPDIVLVGMGTPIQEYWIQENRAAIRAPVVWAVGALFDFVAEIQPRGPRWMLDSGFEWLFRLVSDPKRLWRRYLIGNPLFISRVLLQATASWFSRQEPSYN
jgi:N-acetylglucosaminyldiphosphoundecaprenol N-acetyl-beta-D-mannosaminyltransferase